MAQNTFRSALFEVHLDILAYILDYLPRNALIKLASTCKAFKGHILVQKAMYRDLSDIVELRKLKARNELLHNFCLPRVDQNINAVTGGFVSSLAMPNWATAEQVARLVELCPNIRTVDFSGVVETIDSTRHGTDCEDVCHEQFMWPPVMQSATGLFRNLRHAVLRYGNMPYRPLQRSSYQLPVFLKASPQLQSLELQCLQIFKRRPRAATTDGREPRLSHNALTDILLAELESAPSTLRTLSLKGIVHIVKDVERFLTALGSISNVQTLKLSMYEDLGFYQNCQWAMDDDLIHAKAYIKAVSSVMASSRFNLVVTEPEKASLEPTFCSSMLFPEKPFDLLNLVDWSPFYDWFQLKAEDGLYELLSPSSGSGLMEIDQMWIDETVNSHMVDTHVNREFERIASFFAEMRKSGFPIKVHLDCQEDGAFFTPPPWLAGENLGKALDSDTFEHPELDDLGETISHGYACEEPGFFWGLPAVCTEITELRIVYGECFPQIWETYKCILYNHIKYDFISEAQHSRLRRVLVRQVEKRLVSESKKLALFFRSLKKYTNLAKLILYLPAALYPDSDSTLVDHCLPTSGSGWTVQHHNSGGEVHVPMFRSPIPAVVQITEDLCPIIHRVFTRKPSTEQETKRVIVNNDTEWHKTTRPLVDLKGLAADMELLLRCDMEKHMDREYWGREH